MKLGRKDKHNFMKCIEELNELSLELLHAVNKPNKENAENIRKEIRDVEKYLDEIKIYCEVRV